MRRVIHSAFALLLGIMTGIIAGWIMLGCAAKKTTQTQAIRVIPHECAKVELLDDLPIDKNGKAIGKAKFHVTSTCGTRVKQ
jgi:hypothetical protein